MSNGKAQHEVGKTPADQIWDRFWERACAITRSLHTINDPDAKAENVRLAHRFLAASKNVRCGKTRYGPVTDYITAFKLEKLKKAAQEQAEVKSLFAAHASPAPEKPEQPLSQQFLPNERVPRQEEVESYDLWQSTYNTEPALKPEPRPCGCTLH